MRSHICRAELEVATGHVALVLLDLGLEKSKPVVTLVVKRPKSEEFLLLAGAKLLNAEDTTLYKSVKMRVNCLSLDRPDLSLAAGSLTRGMKSPTTKGLKRTFQSCGKFQSQSVHIHGYVFHDTNGRNHGLTLQIQ